MTVTKMFWSVAVVLVILEFSPVQAAGLFQAMGFKVGEVNDRSAIVWTRLTARPTRNPSDGPKVTIEYQKSKGANKRERKVKSIVFENNAVLRDVREAVPGSDGEVRVLYRLAGTKSKSLSTPWREVDGSRDFTRQLKLNDLQPDSRYDVTVESRSSLDKPGLSRTGSFRTAPEATMPKRIVFTVSTGQGNNDQDRPDGFNIYPEMLKLDPNFFVHTGDMVYYDSLAKTVELARYHWQRTYSWPTNVDFHNQVSSYFIKDDHDTWKNDCWPTMQSPYMHEFTFAQGLEVFREQVPMGESTYRTRRWGKDLQIWMVEGRDFRSANDAPDGPNKTIWGRTQMAWFKRTVQRSDAAFRVLISPTPVVGPDRKNKRDNHSNRVFAYEGNELRKFIASQKNLVVVCGDRHWQYMSVDPERKIREYSCGPASDKHAGGWKQEDFIKKYHRYLNVIGGFLSATVERTEGMPTLTFRYHDVNGKVHFEDRLTVD